MNSCPSSSEWKINYYERRKQDIAWNLTARAACCLSCGLAPPAPVSQGPALTPQFSPLGLFSLWQTAENLADVFCQGPKQMEEHVVSKRWLTWAWDQSLPVPSVGKAVSLSWVPLCWYVFVFVSASASCQLLEIKCCAEYGCRWEKFLFTVCLSYRSKQGV